MTKIHASKKWLKWAGVIAAVAVVFSTGWLGGSGRLDFGRHTAVNANKDLPAKLDYTSVNELYQALKNNFDGELDQTKLMDGLKTGLVNAAGNPYTEYFNKSALQAFNNQLDGSFTGIGAELSLNSQNQVIVISPIAGFPAEKAGLKAHDIITAINGKSTLGMSVSQAVDAIRGPAGSTVTLTVQHEGQNSTTDIKIVRANITIPSVKYSVQNGVGYMQINRFGADTADLAKKAAASFKEQNVKGVVLDMRGNPGGLLDAAVSVSSLWVPQGKTVLTERRDGIVTQTYTATGNDILNGIPTVVLINGGSASASEITAGALKDNGVATLMGTKSFGKGSVQQILNLNGGGALKVTVARWFTPKGKNIDKHGIVPDKIVTITDDQIKAEQDPQKDAAFAALGSRPE